MRGGDVDLDTYFAMARGARTTGIDVTAMEMTKWFDTNYHYLVPELGPDTSSRSRSQQAVDEYAEARRRSARHRPVLVGPVSLLLLAKPADGVAEDSTASACSSGCSAVYGEVLERLAEPAPSGCSSTSRLREDRSERELDALRRAYQRLGKVARAHRGCWSRPTSTSRRRLRGPGEPPVDGSASTSCAAPREPRHRSRRRPARRKTLSPASSTAATSGSTT